MEIITWRPVVGFEKQYLVSNKGHVKSLHKRHTGKLIVQKLDRAEYYTVRLNKNGNTSTKFVHRLVAEAFIPNLNFNKKYINHIDGNRLNNCVENLEWVTHSENMKHACIIGLFKPFHGREVIDLCTGKKFKSIRVAAVENNMKPSKCRQLLNDSRNPTCLRFANENSLNFPL